MRKEQKIILGCMAPMIITLLLAAVLTAADILGRRDVISAIMAVVDMAPWLANTFVLSGFVLPPLGFVLMYREDRKREDLEEMFS